MEIEEALRRLTDRTEPVKETELVSIDEACGHVTAEDIYATDPVPAFERSAMDGYAVRFEDISYAEQEKPSVLKVIDELYAGDFRELHGESGTAVRVMTGAMIPEGYDTVVKQEDTDLGGIEVKVFRSAGLGMNICPVGEEFPAGELVLPKGRRIGRIETGLLASLGINEVKTVRAPRVAIISTGSELTRPGEELPKGHIYGNISYMLKVSVKKAGMDVVCDSLAGDDKELIKSRLEQALKLSDLIITTGGVSVGKRDLMHSVLDEIGAEKVFYRVNIQPGTPTVGSIYKGKAILSLSGNPYAALANFDYYFYPIAAKLTGSASYIHRTAEAYLAEPYEKVNQMRRLVRAYEEGGRVYLRAKGHKSSMFGNMTACNCYIDVPGGTRLAVGDKVTILKYEDQ